MNLINRKEATFLLKFAELLKQYDATMSCNDKGEIEITVYNIYPEDYELLDKNPNAMTHIPIVFSTPFDEESIYLLCHETRKQFEHLSQEYNPVEFGSEED